jgi:S-adenosylmethionine-diacylgycerolhomoserine-N-methlytransferase
LAEADATDFDAEALFGTARFDRIFLSYTLSMIPGWLCVLRHVSHLIGQGGRLDLVDFGQQERLPAPFRAVLFAWLAKFDVTPRGNLQDALLMVAVEEKLALLWQPQLRGYAWTARLERQLP